MLTKININKQQIQELDKQKRVHLINSIGGFKWLGLVGSSDSLGNVNLSIFSSFFHIGANPALIGFIFRPSPPERDTFSNILETGFYTLNHVNESIYRQAHQTSARYAKGISEFDKTGLTPEYKNNFFAPFVAESNIQLGIEFKEKLDISINKTIIVIGEIIEMFIPESCFNESGFVDIEKANSITCSGLDSYHKTVKLDRLSYAKPDKDLTALT